MQGNCMQTRSSKIMIIDWQSICRQGAQETISSWIYWFKRPSNPSLGNLSTWKTPRVIIVTLLFPNSIVLKNALFLLICMVFLSYILRRLNPLSSSSSFRSWKNSPRRCGKARVTWTETILQSHLRQQTTFAMRWTARLIPYRGHTQSFRTWKTR